MKPATSISGTAHQVSKAPPVSIKSVRFIATSIEIIEIKDMPNAVFNAMLNAIWRAKMIVSKMIEVKRPFIMASDMIHRTGQSMPMV